MRHLPGPDYKGHIQNKKNREPWIKNKKQILMASTVFERLQHYLLQIF